MTVEMGIEAGQGFSGYSCQAKYSRKVQKSVKVVNPLLEHLTPHKNPELDQYIFSVAMSVSK